MATVSCTIAATPDEVFAVLADGWYYSNWVVGTSHMRAVEAAWPAAGSKLFHASGVWPVCLRDETTVESSDPGRLLVLTAKGRPFGEAKVTLELAHADGGTLVTMTEHPVEGPGQWLYNKPADVLMARRNTESLARLTALVERRTAPTD